MKRRVNFCPQTPSGLLMFHLKASTFDQAWRNLERSAAPTPFNTKEDLIKRGFSVVRCTGRAP